MRLGTSRAGFAATLCTAVLALGGAGCGSSDEPKNSNAAPASQPPQACASEPLGQAQDGVNDEQGGSTPGTDPCDGPGT